jgi:hypothetical protein
MSQLNVLSCRPLATILPTADGRYEIQAALTRESMAQGGRSVPQTFRADDFQMRPGSIYMALTGLIFANLSSAAQLHIRASTAAWQAGLVVLRQDFVGKNRELVIWFDVRQPTTFTRNVPLFEAEILTLGVPVPMRGPMAPAASAAPRPMAPGEVLLAPQAERRLEAPRATSPGIPAPAGGQTAAAQAAAAAQAVHDWLNTPDKHAGHVVETPDVPIARPVPMDRASGASITTADPSQRINDAEISSVDYSQAINPARDRAMVDFARGNPVDPAFMNPTANAGAALVPPPLPVSQSQNIFDGLNAAAETAVTEIFLPPPLPPRT